MRRRVLRRPVTNQALTTYTVQDDSGLVARFVPAKPSFTDPLGPGFSGAEIHLNFHQHSSVRLNGGVFTSLGADDLSALQAVLDSWPEVGAVRCPVRGRTGTREGPHRGPIGPRTGRQEPLLTSIVPETVRFEGARSRNDIFHIGDSFELDDRTRDGDDDARMQFATRDTDLVSGPMTLPFDTAIAVSAPDSPGPTEVHSEGS